MMTNILDNIRKEYMKIPYKLHGRDFNGCDCWGLIILFYKIHLKIDLIDLENKKFKSDWYKTDNYFIENYHKQWQKVERLKLFDLIFFQNYEGIVNHCGIYLGNNIFMQTTEKHGVTFIPVERFKNKIYGFFRLKQNDKN